MSDAPTPNVDVRRATDRFKTRIGWLDSKHSSSFSNHWDPGNTHHGPLLVNNDDIVTADAPFSHLLGARATVDMAGVGVLNEGDAVRFTDVGGKQLSAVEGAEVLIWEMHAQAA